MSKVQPTTGIDMSDLNEVWPTMPPSARRHAMRARILGTDRGLFAWIGKMLGFSWKPTPPSAQRVAARSMILSAVEARTHLELHLDQIKNPDKVDLLASLKELGITGELERQERDYLQAPLGRADKPLVAASSWRVEGLGVLAWALNRFTLPPYDQRVCPIAAQDSVGFANPDLARQLFASAGLRPSAEIELFATRATLVTWRLRQFRMAPGPWDFDSYLRRHASFRETWLEGLRFLDGDLAIGAQAIFNAPAEEIERCERTAVERQIAAYWLQGDAPVYSKVDPSTLLSAC